MNRASESASSKLQSSLISICFFLSGFTSLVLETAWSKQLSYILGVDLFGTATTVVAYMTGLGIGAYLAARYAERLCERPLRWYAIVQLLIAVAGVTSIPFLLLTTPLFSLLYGIDHSQLLFIGLRFFVTLVLLLPATTLMGMTLPIVVGAASGSRGSAQSAGLLYGINTLGAVVGAGFAGFLFIPSWGLLGTCVFAGLSDLLIAAVVWWLSRLDDGATTTAPKPLTGGAGPPVPYAFPVLLALAFSGASALGLELSWFRLFVQIAGPTVTAFSVTLGVFLTGIGLGSAIFGPLSRIFKDARLALVATLAWTTLSALLPAFFLDEIPVWYLELWQKWGSLGRDVDLLKVQIAIASFIILPATLGLGASFPAGVAAYQHVLPSFESTSGGARRLSVVAGRLFYFNTIGAVVGAIVWAFFVLPLAGAAGGIKIAAAVATCGIVVLWAFAEGKSDRVPVWYYLGPAALFFLVTLVPPVNPRMQNAGLFSAVRAPEAKGKVDVSPLRKEAQLLFSKEGYSASVAVIKNRHGRNSIDISYSGKWVASTHPSSVRHLVLLGELPMLAARKAPESALVIGLGSGITSGSVLRHNSLVQVDIVEIEPAVLEASAFFNAFSHDPVHDPRVRIILQDGRTHVVFGREKYDVITSDPIHPWVKGAANLYTQEFYFGARARLNEGGVYCQWIPSSMSQYSFDSIVKTMRSAFLDVKLLFSGGEAIALASMSPIVFDAERLNQALSDPEVRTELAGHRIGDRTSLERFLAQRLRVAGSVDEMDGTINTDDNVFLEHALPWEMFRGDRAREQGFPLASH